MKSIIHRLEQQKNIKVIWAGYVGSKLKGYANSKSDVDLQLIYLPKNTIFTYLSDSSFEDQFSLSQDNFDVVAWDLRKLVERFEVSDFKAFEMIKQDNLLSCPNVQVDNLDRLFNESAELSFNGYKVAKAFSKMAYNNLSDINSLFSDSTDLGKIAKKILQSAYWIYNLEYISKHKTVQVNLKFLIKDKPELLCVLEKRKEEQDFDLEELKRAYELLVDDFEIAKSYLIELEFQFNGGYFTPKTGNLQELLFKAICQSSEDFRVLKLKGLLDYD